MEESSNQKTNKQQEGAAAPSSSDASLQDDAHVSAPGAEESAEEVKLIAGRFKPSDIFKFVGLAVFFALMALVSYLVWPYIGQLFESGDIGQTIDQLQNAGFAGALILLGMQFLQIVVAFIPGEVVQVAAGVMYGPWLGALIILVGCVGSSAFVFVIVRKLGAPFVRDIIPMTWLEKFRHFESTGKLDILVFILFIIPGLPKDTFTYLVPLTDMTMKKFLILSNVGRIPGVLMSTFAASGLAEGRYVESIVIAVVAAVLAVLGVLFQKKLTNLIEKVTKRN